MAQTMVSNIERWLKRYLADRWSLSHVIVSDLESGALYVQWATDGETLREEVSSLGVQADPAGSSERHVQLIGLGYRPPSEDEFNYWRDVAGPFDAAAIARNATAVFTSILGLPSSALHHAEDGKRTIEEVRREPRPQEPIRPERPAGSAPASDGNQTDVYESLRELAELRADGIITDAEFEQKKTELLGRI